MAELPSVEQAGTATVWFTTQAGITATVLAVFCIVLIANQIWMVRRHAAEILALNSAHAELVKALGAGHHVTIEALIAKWIDQVTEWAKRIDGFRGDIKDAFGENNAIADKVVDALMNVKLEIARMGGRSDHARR